jgi:hypothetical protein
MCDHAFNGSAELPKSGLANVPPVAGGPFEVLLSR